MLNRFFFHCNYSSLKKYITNNALLSDSVWALLGSVLGKGLALLSSICIARLLGKDIYGEYGFIKSTLLNISIFSTLGLGYTSTRFVAKYLISEREKVNSVINETLRITLVTSFLLASVFFFFSDIFSQWLGSPQLSMAFKYTSLIIIFNAITSTQIGILSGFNAYKVIAKINTISGISIFVLSLLLTYFFLLEGALVALLISQILNCLLNYYAIRRYNIREKNNLLKTEILLIRKDLISFSLPVALQEIFYSLTQWSLTVLLIKMSTYGEVGIYTAVSQWASVIMFIPGILRNVTLSYLSNSLEDNLKFDNITNMMLKINIISILIPSVLVFLSSDLISAFYGESFHTLKPVLRVYILIPIFDCISNVYVQSLLSKGRTWILFFLRLLRDVGTLTLTFFFIVLFGNFSNNSGALNLAVASLIFQIIFCLFLYIENRRIKFSPMCN